MRLIRLLAALLLPAAPALADGDAAAGTAGPPIARLDLSTLDQLSARPRLEIIDGRLRISTGGPTEIPLLRLQPEVAGAGRLIYSARLKAENLDGQAHLTMWVGFGGQERYFSKGLDAPIGGTTDWQTRRIPFHLKQGQAPKEVILSVTLTGPGTLWLEGAELLFMR